MGEVLVRGEALFDRIGVGVMLSGCEQFNSQKGQAALTAQSLMALCRKSVDSEDVKAASKDCSFTEQSQDRLQPDSLEHAQVLEILGDLLVGLIRHWQIPNLQRLWRCPKNKSAIQDPLIK